MKNNSFLSAILSLMILAVVALGLVSFIRNYEPKSDMNIEESFLVNDEKSITKKKDVSDINIKAKLTVEQNLTITITNNTSSEFNVNSKGSIRKVERTQTSNGFRYKITSESKSAEVVRGYLNTSKTKSIAPYSEGDVILDCSHVGLYPGDYLLELNGYYLYFHLENLDK